MGSEDATALWFAPEWRAAAPQPASHRLPLGTEQRGDSAQGHAFGVQTGSLLIARLSALEGGLAYLLRPGQWAGHGCGLRRRRMGSDGRSLHVGSGLRSAAERATIPIGECLHSIAKIAQQMPAVGRALCASGLGNGVRRSAVLQKGWHRCGRCRRAGVSRIC